MLLHDFVQQPAAAVESFRLAVTAGRRSGMADCLESDVDETAIACRERSYARRRRVFSIERGKAGREPAPFGVGVEKCLPARRDPARCGAPDSERFGASVCPWRAGQGHLESEDERREGEGSCVAPAVEPPGSAFSTDPSDALV